MSYSPSGTGLEIGAAAAALAGLITFCLFLYYRRLHFKQASIDYDSPQFQIEALKKRTLDFGVVYSELQFGQLIGKGSQGEVFKANWRGSVVAVKKVDTRKVSEEIIEEFCQEAEIMRRLRHPSLTLFMGVSLEHPHLCIVTEFVSRGSLFDILHEAESGFTWSKALGIAVDVAQGMTYLHAHTPPILHRDLKSLNILCDSHWSAKVADFGMTRFQDKENGTMTQCGSPLWMSPEMIKNDPYDEKADVYSFAIVLWELYTKQIPYRDLNLNPSLLVVKVVKEGLRPTIPPNCPRPYADLIKACWHRHAEKRPTFSAILKILEKLATDPKIYMHKPMSEMTDSGAANSQQQEEEEEKSPENLAQQQLLAAVGNSGWKIPDKNLVELLTPLKGNTTIIQTPGESGGDFSSPGKSLEFPIYRAKYRGAHVILHRYRLFPPAPGKSSSSSSAGEKEKDSNNTKIWSLMEKCANLRHPNLLLFMGAYLEDSIVGVIEEECSRGGLNEFLNAENRIPIEWNLCFDLLIGAVQGLLYLHGQKVFHQDFHTGRLLLTENWSVKISHAGFVNINEKLYGKSSSSSSSSSSSISLWSAPELFDNPTAITERSNIYSLALVMWHVLTRKFPYEGRFGPKLRKKIQEGFRLPFPPSVPEKMKSLIKQCWQTDPNRRPTLSSVLEQLQAIKADGPSKFKLEPGNSHKYRKATTVFAYRSKDPLTVLKDWGKNVGKAGSWLIAGEDGDLYMCEEAVFERTYQRAERENEYRKVGEILGRQMSDAFAIKTEAGPIEQGNAGDFLVQNENGDQWVIDGKTFGTIYERVDMENPANLAIAGQDSSHAHKNLLAASSTLLPTPGVQTASEIHSSSISVSVNARPLSGPEPLKEFERATSASSLSNDGSAATSPIPPTTGLSVLVSTDSPANGKSNRVHPAPNLVSTSNVSLANISFASPLPTPLAGNLASPAAPSSSKQGKIVIRVKENRESSRVSRAEAPSDGAQPADRKSPRTLQQAPLPNGAISPRARDGKPPSPVVADPLGPALPPGMVPDN